MVKLEQKFCTALQKWIHANMKQTFCWEAKVITQRVMNYKSHIPEHQVRNLKICGRHFIYKISDIDAMTQKPFDGLSITEAPGYFFVRFEMEPKGEFYIIPVESIEEEINNGIKSLTPQRASEIASRVGIL